MIDWPKRSKSYFLLKWIKKHFFITWSPQPQTDQLALPSLGVQSFFFAKSLAQKHSLNLNLYCSWHPQGRGTVTKRLQLDPISGSRLSLPCKPTDVDPNTWTVKKKVNSIRQYRTCANVHSPGAINENIGLIRLMFVEFLERLLLMKIFYLSGCSLWMPEVSALE